MNYEEAIERLESGVPLKPDFELIYRKRTEIAILKGMPDDARYWLKKLKSIKTRQEVREFACVLQIYLECSEAVQAVIRDMVDIVHNGTAQEAVAALLTIAEALDAV